MKQPLETNRIITGSLFIIATIAVSFILNFAQPFLVPLVIALLIRILIDPIIDYQIDFLHVHRIVAVFVSLCLIILQSYFSVPKCECVQKVASGVPDWVAHVILPPIRSSV